MSIQPRQFDRATITYVVDGDTCDIRIDLGFGVSVVERFRLAAINTPERGQPGFTEATDFLVRYVGVPITVMSTRTDKYGRFLAELWCNGVSINAAIIAAGLAVPYTP